MNHQLNEAQYFHIQQAVQAVFFPDELEVHYAMADDNPDYWDTAIAIDALQKVMTGHGRLIKDHIYEGMRKSEIDYDCYDVGVQTLERVSVIVPYDSTQLPYAEW